MAKLRWVFLGLSLVLIFVACQKTSPKPGITISSPADGSSIEANQIVSFAGTVIASDGSKLADEEQSWELRYYSAKAEPEVVEKLEVSSGQGSFNSGDFGDDLEKVELCLSASGFETTCINLVPKKVTYRFETSPSGLSLEWNGESRTTPFEVKVLVGAERELSAPVQQNDLEFVSWNDAGLSTRKLTIGKENKTLTATYEERAPTASCAGLAQEAESGVVFGDMKVLTSVTASGGKAVGSDENSSVDYSENPDARHRVDYCMKVATPGIYRIKTWVAGESVGADSFLVQLNQGDAYTYSFADIVRTANPFPNFTEDYVKGLNVADPLEFSLSAGEQRLSFYLREDGAQLDKLELELVKATPDAGFLETISIASVTTDWQQVSLTQSYESPIVICTAQRENNNLPAVVRVQKASKASFELKLQNPSGNALVAESVYCLVAEQGVWQLPDGRKFEAQLYETAQVDGALSNWAGQKLGYENSYAKPVVFGQIMSANNAVWGSFWSRGESKSDAPSAQFVRMGLQMGEDPAQEASNRQAEQIAYMVFEAGAGTVAGSAYEVALGASAIAGVDNAEPGGSYNFGSSFASVPQFAVASQAGMNGGDGSWASLAGVDALSQAAIKLIGDEDQVADSERWHPEERVSYLVFEKGVSVALTRP